MDEISILHIDGDPDSAELVSIALRGLPVPQRIKHFNDADAVLAWLDGDAARMSANAFALLEARHIADLGCAPVVALRRTPGLRGLPIVVLVGASDPSAIAAAYRCGANSVVQRSFDPTELVATMQQVAGYWLLRNVSALEREG